MSYNKTLLNKIMDKLDKPTKFTRPRNQWQDPGEITTIPGNSITMQGVSFPVYAQPNAGPAQMMYPNQEYYFPEATSVTEYPIMAGGGYVVTRSNDRKGKTHKVTGPDGTVKYFGDSSMGQHPKDPERKKAFYARHKKNLQNNPYFRAFARKTWAEGGEITAYQNGGSTDSTLENIVEVFDPTGISSYDDVYRSARDNGILSWQTGLEVLGALPLVGKMGKVSKAGIHLAKYKGIDKFLYKNLPQSAAVSNVFQAAGIAGRTSDAAQAAMSVKESPLYRDGGQTRNEREMVNGIADILSQVADPQNRAAIAANMVKDFEREDVTYDINKFMKMSKLQNGGTLLNDKTNNMYFQRGGQRSQNGWDASENPGFVNAMQQEWLSRPATKAMFAAQAAAKAKPKGHKKYTEADMAASLDAVMAQQNYGHYGFPFAPALNPMLPPTAQGLGYTTPNAYPFAQFENGGTNNEGFQALPPYVQAKIKANMAKGGTWMAPNYFEKGGEMIRRADGSYSKRGLWDNIRANKGSGKKPTKEMLAQERKIRKEEMKYGGEFAKGGTNNPGFDALPEFVQAKILSNMGYGGYHNPYMQQGGYKPLSQEELSALAHQYRGMGSSYLQSDPYVMEHQSIKNELGYLTPREKGQLAKYMQGNGALEAIWQAMPNFLGSSGAAELPKKSRLRDSLRKDYFHGDNGYQDWVNYMEKRGYANGGEVMEVSAAEAERLRQQGYQFEIIG